MHCKRNCAMLNCIGEVKLLEKAFMPDDLCGSEVSSGVGYYIKYMDMCDFK